MIQQGTTITKVLAQLSSQLRENDVQVTTDSSLGITGQDFEIVIYAVYDDCDISTIHQLLEVRNELIEDVFKARSLPELRNTLQTLYEWLAARGFDTGVRTSRTSPWPSRLYNRARLFILDKLWHLF